MRESITKLLLRLAAMLVPSIVIQGCSMFGNIIEEHAQVCQKQKGVIVHNEKLWHEYQRLAEATYSRRDDEYRVWIASDKGPKRVPDGPNIPPHTGRMYLEAVDGFDQRYGKDIDNIRPTYAPRPYSDEQIVRDDLFLIKNKTVILQVVDYTAGFTSPGGGSTGLNCLGDYGIIYSNKRDV